MEGVRAVSDMLQAGVEPTQLFVRAEPEDEAILEQLNVSCPVRMATSDVLATLSDVPHPQGFIAVVPNDAVSWAPMHDVWADDLVLVADGVRDPGNLGTLLRSAAGAGITQVLVTPNSVDPFNPKCVRSAMGAHFLVSLQQVTYEQAIGQLQSLPVIAVADAEGDMDYDAVAWSEPCAIIVGSEAFGPNAALSEIATAYVRIPLARNLESLNAGVAGSHLVLEAARHRRLAAS